MIDEHEDCYTCYLCNKYFETKHSLKHHNEFIHKEFSEMTETENDETFHLTAMKESMGNSLRNIRKARKTERNKGFR
jgi:hypothetical protein